MSAGQAAPLDTDRGRGPSRPQRFQRRGRTIMHRTIAQSHRPKPKRQRQSLPADGFIPSSGSNQRQPLTAAAVAAARSSSPDQLSAVTVDVSFEFGVLSGPLLPFTPSRSRHPPRKLNPRIIPLSSPSYSPLSDDKFNHDDSDDTGSHHDAQDDDKEKKQMVIMDPQTEESAKSSADSEDQSTPNPHVTPSQYPETSRRRLVVNATDSDESTEDELVGSVHNAPLQQDRSSSAQTLTTSTSHALRPRVSADTATKQHVPARPSRLSRAWIRIMPSSSSESDLEDDADNNDDAENPATFSTSVARTSLKVPARRPISMKTVIPDSTTESEDEDYDTPQTTMIQSSDSEPSEEAMEPPRRSLRRPMPRDSRPRQRPRTTIVPDSEESEDIITTAPAAKRHTRPQNNKDSPERSDPGPAQPKPTPLSRPSRPQRHAIRTSYVDQYLTSSELEDDDESSMDADNEADSELPQPRPRKLSTRPRRPSARPARATKATGAITAPPNRDRRRGRRRHSRLPVDTDSSSSEEEEEMSEEEPRPSRGADSTPFESGGHHLRKRRRTGRRWTDGGRLRERNSTSLIIETYDWPSDGDYRDPGSVKRKRKRGVQEMKAGNDDEDAHNSCPVCYVDFGVPPVILPCGGGKHRFCHPCFRRLRSEVNKTLGWLMCPICRAEHSMAILKSALKMQGFTY